MLLSSCTGHWKLGINWTAWTAWTQKIILWQPPKLQRQLQKNVQKTADFNTILNL